MKKLWWGLLLALGMVLMQSAAASAAYGTVREAATEEELTAALADGAYGTIRLAANIEIGSTLLVSRTVTLDLNGYVLKMTGSGSVIRVYGGGDLTLEDSNTDNQIHKFTVDGNGLWIFDDSTTDADARTVIGGAITGGSADDGGGVSVENASLMMQGGNIVGCTSSRYGGTVRRTGQASGSAGWVEIYTSAGNNVFNMYGGTIGNPDGAVGGDGDGNFIRLLNMYGGTATVNAYGGRVRGVVEDNTRQGIYNFGGTQFESTVYLYKSNKANYSGTPVHSGSGVCRKNLWH